MLKNSLLVIFLLTFFAVLFPFTLMSQSGIGASSPYSKYGLGNLYNLHNDQARSMGGISYALRNTQYINFNNPASYASIDSSSFLFEVGGAGQFLTLSTNAMEETASAFSVSHMLFGFPVTRWWRSSFGMLPYSGMDYNITDADSSQLYGFVDYYFTGNGGINRVFVGNAIKIADFLSVGFNFNYLYGSYNNVQTAVFADTNYFLNLEVTNKTSVRDFYFDYGLQLHHTFKSGLTVNAGAVYNNPQSLTANREYLARNFFYISSNVTEYEDTVKQVLNEDGSLLMPRSYGFGVTLSNGNRWLIGADYDWRNWGAFTSFDETVGLNDSYNVAVGAQYSPSNYGSMSYWQKLDYRIGARYTNSYLSLRDKKIDDFGITFGLGLPIRSIALRGSKAKFNIGAEIGSRGSLQNDLIQENYFNFFFSVSIYEWWFLQRKFD